MKTKYWFWTTLIFYWSGKTVFDMLVGIDLSSDTTLILKGIQKAEKMECVDQNCCYVTFTTNFSHIMNNGFSHEIWHKLPSSLSVWSAPQDQDCFLSACDQSIFRAREMAFSGQVISSSMKSRYYTRPLVSVSEQVFGPCLLTLWK